MNRESKGLPGSWRAAAALQRTIIVLTLLFPGTLIAATEEDELDELDEVLIDGQKPSRNPSELFTWMRRLVGQFTYEGHVDLRGQGNPEDQLPVRGQGSCVGFGPAPGVLCNIRIVWQEAKGTGGKDTGGFPSLNPATILYGFEPNDVGIRFMIVDSKGLAEPALGRLVGDTLISKAPCVNTPGICQRTTRIHAQPDGKVIEIQIEIERDYRKAHEYRFVLRRVAQAQPP